uniref:TetR/AcrR family transcriptional regulator n=1 Tax=Oxalobacter formigenes TaxID=847 RepID=UPI003C6E777B
MLFSGCGMKKRTEEKREAILDAATAVFRDMGFHNASMNAIAARLGGYGNIADLADAAGAAH